MNKSRTIIDQQELYKKADIIFITDGEAPVGDKWVQSFTKWRDDNKVSVYGILIDAGWNSDSAMKLFCTSINKLSGFNDDSREELAITLFDAM